MNKRFFVRAAIAASCLVAASVGQAHAQANQSSVRQDGTNNGAAIVQSGQGNTAGIRQFGRSNTGSITQTGDNNAACLIQFGRGLDGAIVQVGDNQNTGLVQTRRGVQPIPTELCAADSDRRGFWRAATRNPLLRRNR